MSGARRVAPGVTERGRSLAWKLNPAIGTTVGIERTCSQIAALAKNYGRIQEAWCNEEMSDRRTAELEARELAIEARICELVRDLPEPDEGSWGVEFSGYPRGSTVKIVAPPALVHLHDDWGKVGICADVE